MKILLTSTSFQDTPGKHQDLLDAQAFEIDRLRGPISENELLNIIADYDAIICGDDDITERVLVKGKMGRLKYISKYGVGLDKIDLKAAKSLNIPVKNCPGVNQVSVAEHVFALLFTFERNIHIEYNITREGGWKRITGNEINGKTIGIIGLGAIGKEVAKRAGAFGLKVLAYDINKDDEFLKIQPQVIFVSNLETIFAASDYLSLHTPLLESTRNIISEAVIKNKLAKYPVIINTSRGGLVDSVGISEGIKNKKIRGYLTDVLDIEPMAENEILKNHPNVIITPHIGSRTVQSVERQGLMAVNNLIEMMKT